MENTTRAHNEHNNMERNNRTYYFCKKCNKGEGMWVLHPEKDHKDNYKPNFEKSKSTQNGDSSKNQTDSDSPSIQVRKDLLSNAKAFLAARKDFQAGGTQD